jgi:uncharacterized protein YegL
MADRPSVDKEFADNLEPRCAVALVVDTSASMDGAPIQELNEGLRAFHTSLRADKLASLRVEIALIAFGGRVRAIDVRSGSGEVPLDARQAFVSAMDFTPPTLTASGDTPMGYAAREAMKLLRQRKDIYKQQPVDYYRPWFFLISDGAPTDLGWEAVADEVRAEEQRKGFSLYAVGVEGANLGALARFCGARQPLRLRGLAFQELFLWLSKSLSSVSGSETTNTQIALPAADWAHHDATH